MCAGRSQYNHRVKPRREADELDEEPTRRTSDRAQLRAALALEEAGELQEAARMFEYVGEHAQAASLRLEHADTLRDEQQRLAVLREGCARNPANTAQGQALHRALGEALLRVAEGVEPGARRRALALEAAQALEEGQRPDQAGRLYEQLGLLSRASKAYTDAGDIERLERVLDVLEQREQREREQRNLELEVEAAMMTGRRRQARVLLLDHLRDLERAGKTPATGIAQPLHELERRLIPRGAVILRARELGAGSDYYLRLFGRQRLRLGRGPQCELPVKGAALSREHTELVLGSDELGEPPTPRLLARDLGSRAGSFLDGDPLVPGDDWVLYDEHEASARELALGIAASFELWSRIDPDERPQALVREAGLADARADGRSHAWTAFFPLGGQLWLEPELSLPIELDFEEQVLVVRAAPDVRVSLSGSPIGPGESVDLLLLDRARFDLPEGQQWELEVEEP